MLQMKKQPYGAMGTILVFLLAITSTAIANLGVIRQLGLSPLIVGILLGMVFANTLRRFMPQHWVKGILFCTKTVLRIGIVFYGFRLTFQNILNVGFTGFIISAAIVTLTFILGYFVGIHILKMDRDTTILTAAGSSICGAAAILATEPVIKAEPYKSAVAVSTVVLFGTIAMFLYPALYKLGLIDLNPTAMGLFTGGTLHEVAHVVGAGNAIGVETAQTAVIIKMIRVMLLAPFLLILGYWLARKDGKNMDHKAIVIPWFAVYFIAVAGFNSLHLLPGPVVEQIVNADTFLLTMAMTALGMETTVAKFRQAGIKPVFLAGILFIWLFFGGFLIVKLAA